MATFKLGAFATSMKGSSENTTFIRRREGVVVRNRTIPTYSKTPKQSQARTRMTDAARAWGELTLEQAAQWRAYAESLSKIDLDTGARVGPRAQTLFTKLAMKVRQVDPHTEIPPLPPSSAFSGDGISVSVSAGENAILFSASGPNSEGVVTELLLQPLLSRHRRAYADKYRTQAFVAFSGEPVHVEAPVGFFAAAYRFVRAATGQESPLFELGLVQVVPVVAKKRRKKAKAAAA